MAEYIDGESVLFCRHAFCWRLDMGPNTWHKVSGFQTQRDRAASAEVVGTMAVLGGVSSEGQDIIGVELYNRVEDRWEDVSDLNLETGRYR